MGEKIKLTRPELKHRRELLARYERYLPTLELKQRLLQRAVLEAVIRLADARAEQELQAAAVAASAPLRFLPAGIDLERFSEPLTVRTATINIAGVVVPSFVEAEFEAADYGLLGTEVWVDTVLDQLIVLARQKARADLLERQLQLIRAELRRVNQRLNLFEKVMIPKTRRAIQVIRISLGDEQTAAVGRAKIAKGKQRAQVAGGVAARGEAES